MQIENGEMATVVYTGMAIGGIFGYIIGVSTQDAYDNLDLTSLNIDDDPVAEAYLGKNNDDFAGLYLRDGEGNYSPAVEATEGDVWVNRPFKLLAGDIDHDNEDELVFDGDDKTLYFEQHDSSNKMEPAAYEIDDNDLADESYTVLATANQD